MTSNDRAKPAPNSPAPAAMIAVAAYLASQSRCQVYLGAFRAIADEHGAAAVRAEIQRLHTLGFVRIHRGRNPIVAVLHRDGLARLGAGEPLPAVAADVERDRPLTVIRTQDGRYAAWFLSVLLLPSSACVGRADSTAVIGATAEEAEQALRRRARAALHPVPAQIGQ